MAILQVLQNVKLSASYQAAGVREYDETWYVKSTVYNENPLNVISAVDPNSGLRIPSYLSTNAQDPYAHVVSYNPANDPDSPDNWVVQVHYSSQTTQAQQNNNTANPIDWEVKVTWGSDHFQRPLIWDAATGKAVVNFAGDRYDPAYAVDDDRTTVSITKNFLAIPTWVLTYKKKTNASALTIEGILVAALHARIWDIRIGPKQRHNGIVFRPLTLDIQLKKVATSSEGKDHDGNSVGWKAKVVELGYNEMQWFVGAATDPMLWPALPSGTTTQKKAAVMDLNGIRPTAPALLQYSLSANGKSLNGKGRAMQKPEHAAWDADSAEAFTVWNAYETADYSVLDFIPP